MADAPDITVPLLDLRPQYEPIREEIEQALRDVIQSQRFILGPVVEEFEAEAAAYCGVNHAVGCASGSDALMLALMALGIGAGDEVICPSSTFFATAGSISRCGATPVFADIDPVTYNVDPDSVRSAASRCTRLKAIMPVHLFGRCADMDAMLALGEELGVPVIEDAAQAIGARDERSAAAGSRGAAGCFSFFPSKNLGCFGDGGMLTTSDDALAERLRVLRVHGGQPKYYHKFIGVNSRLDALQAAVLRVKLRHLDSWTAGRQENAAHYDRLFAAAGAATTASRRWDDAELPLRTPEPPGPPQRHVYNQYVIRVPAEQRDPLREHLASRNIGTEIYYPVPLHLQECFAPLGYQRGDLPETEAAAEETLALPIYAELTAEQRGHVADSVIEFLKSRAAMEPAGRSRSTAPA